MNSFTSSVFPSEVNGETEKNFLSCGRFHSLLVAFRNSKTRRHSEIQQTRPSTKQHFSGEALSNQNTKASPASLSCNSSQAPSEWSAIFAFGVCCWKLRVLKSVSKVETFENALFWECPIPSVKRWEWRLLQMVLKKASYTVTSISIFGRCSVEDRRKGIKKHALSCKNVLVWTVENKAKR